MKQRESIRKRNRERLTIKIERVCVCMRERETGHKFTNMTYILSNCRFEDYLSFRDDIRILFIYKKVKNWHFLYYKRFEEKKIVEYVHPGGIQPFI